MLRVNRRRLHVIRRPQHRQPGSRTAVLQLGPVAAEAGVPRPKAAPRRSLKLPATPFKAKRRPKSDAPQSTGVSAAPIGLSEVARAWKDIRLALKPSHPAVEALLNSCKPVEVQGQELLIGFQSETVRALMDKPENIKAAQQAIAEVLSANLTVRCIVTNARGKVPPSLPQDGMVATAVDRGGEIVDLQE